MKWAVWNRKRFAALLVLSLLLQPIRGVADHGLDLVLVVVVLGSLRLPLAQAALWGLAAGLIQDLSSISWVGPHMISNSLSAVLAGWMRNRIYRERIFTQGLLVLAAAGFKQFVLWALWAWDGGDPAFGDVLALMGRTLLATTGVGFAASALLVRYGRRYHDPATA